MDGIGHFFKFKTVYFEKSPFMLIVFGFSWNFSMKKNEKQMVFSVF